MSPSSTSSPEIKSFYDLKADLKNSTLDFADLRGKVSSGRLELDLTGAAAARD